MIENSIVLPIKSNPADPDTDEGGSAVDGNATDVELLAFIYALSMPVSLPIKIIVTSFGIVVDIPRYFE